MCGFKPRSRCCFWAALWLVVSERVSALLIRLACFDALSVCGVRSFVRSFTRSSFVLSPFFLRQRLKQGKPSTIRRRLLSSFLPASLTSFASRAHSSRDPTRREKKRVRLIPSENVPTAFSFTGRRGAKNTEMVEDGRLYYIVLQYRPFSFSYRAWQEAGKSKASPPRHH